MDFLAAIASLFPAGIEVVSTSEFIAESPFEGERVITRKAVAKRRADFATGRACARSALKNIGVDVGPILRLGDRLPAWPAGTVGSISHTQGICVAAVANSSVVRSVGIDIEQLARMSDGVRERVCTPRELRESGPLPSEDARAMLVFCIKEAFYKAQYVLTEQFLGFQDAEVYAADGRFRVQFQRDAGEFDAGAELGGCYVVSDDYVAAGCWIPLEDQGGKEGKCGDQKGA